MAKKKEYKVMHWLNHGCYHGYTMFCVGYSYKEIIVSLKKKKNAEDWLAGLLEEEDFINSGQNFAMRRTLENKKTGDTIHLHYIIFTKIFDFSDWDMCKLAHEILHICQFFLPDFLDRNREIEAEAYFHTHLMNQCLTILRTGKP